MKLRNRWLAVRRAIPLAWRTFAVRAFGTYINSVGGPDDFDDGSVWEYKGKQYKFSEPRDVIIRVRIDTLPHGIRDAILELRLAQ